MGDTIDAAEETDHWMSSKRAPFRSGVGRRSRLPATPSQTDTPTVSRPPFTPPVIVAVEAVVGHVAVRTITGTTVGPHRWRNDGGPPTWEIVAGTIGDPTAPMVIVAGSPIAVGPTAHFGWVRALLPDRLFVCRRSVHLLWRHPSTDADLDERLAGYADMASAVINGDKPPDRLHRIALGEITELATDLDQLVHSEPAR